MKYKILMVEDEPKIGQKHSHKIMRMPQFV